jgi:hypothetical protein
VTQSLYQRILGTAFDELSPTLKRIHDSRVFKRYVGHCDIVSDANAAARLIVRIAGLPRGGTNVRLAVTMECKDGSEAWTRDFGAQRMRSSLQYHKGHLRERLGPVVFAFELMASAERIDWHLVSARLWPVPLPITWLLICSAAETMEDGRYTFDVSARVRGVGLIVHYKGWLAES